MLKALLLLLKVGKLGKVFYSLGSMLLSIGVYAMFYGWRYAAGFVGLIFVHELGHYLAAKQRRLPVSLPTFIPFVGAWIELKEQPMDAETEAFVGMAGPMLGSAASYVLYLVSYQEEGGLVLALAYAGFFLNLFNLIPLTPLDGGRIVGVVSRKIWFLGVPILIALFFWNHSPMLLLIAIFATPHLWSAFKHRHEPDTAYYQTSPTVRWQYGLQYLALVAFLAMLSYETHEKLAHLRMG